MERLEKFAEIFAAPDFVLPYLEYFLTAEEIDLVIALGRETANPAQLFRLIDREQPEAEHFVEQCYLSHVLEKTEKEGVTAYRVSDFYAKLDYQCKFGERYQQLDQKIRERLDGWCYEVYKQRMLPYIAQLSGGGQTDRKPETFELLENIDELLAKAEQIRVVPCNCRRLAENCGKPVETCLAFDASITDTTLGQPLTGEEAKAIILQAHKKGLMHQVNSDWRENGPFWMCNCCSCCCYPTRLAAELGSKGVFPVVQYTAVLDPLKCNHCGACVRRCNFRAFSFETEEINVNGRLKKKVTFNAGLCWGCGLCQTTCKPRAITMRKAGGKAS